MHFRESLYTLLCGSFLTSLTLGKVVGVTKFKVTFAALDTPLFYLGVHLRKDRVASTDEPAPVA